MPPSKLEFIVARLRCSRKQDHCATPQTEPVPQKLYRTITVVDGKLQGSPPLENVPIEKIHSNVLKGKNNWLWELHLSDGQLRDRLASFVCPDCANDYGFLLQTRTGIIFHLS